MDAREIIRFQLRGSFSLLLERLRDVGDDEWNRRPVDDASRIGFVLWHCARTVDWAVNLVAARRGEVAGESHWRGRLGAEEGLFGAAIPHDVADAIPSRVSRKTVLAYVTDVQGPALQWLESVSPADLERVTDLMADDQSKPEYRIGEVWEEIEDLSGIPLWQFVSRPSVTHVRFHLGQLDSLLDTLRVPTTSSRPAD